MSQKQKCRGCGAEVDAGALFCARCGRDMTLLGDDDPTLAVTTAGSPVTPVRSTMRQALRDATLGEYEILSELGRGGMATVFLAHDISLDRRVAIKVMAPNLLEGEGMAERFKLEARTAAQLSHPHIIPIYAVKETDETLYFVMKYVEGRGLDSIIKKTGQLPIPMVKDILTKVGNALGYAHRRDVVHRDVKPANIMIDEEGTPIVTDFGIAKVSRKTTGLTQTGSTIGTPSYMSPEQCEARAVTGASDQYSLGIVAFEMLTGKLPFEGDSAVTTMYKHCTEPLPPLEDFRPDCPADIRETIERMVAKEPAERWPSMEAAIRRLDSDSTPTSIDPVRDHLIELVKEGDADELLARLSDPAGPVASTSGPLHATPAGTAPRSRSRWIAAAAVVATMTLGGALWMTQPWAQGAALPLQNGPGATTPGAGQSGTPNPADGGGDGAAAPGDGGATESVADGGEAVGLGPPPGPEPGAQSPSDGGTGTTGASAGGATPAPAAPSVVAVRISGAPSQLEPGGTARLSAAAVDGGGSPVPGTAVSWRSSNPSVASVDQNGLVTANGPGPAVLIASAAGESTSVTITVGQAPVTSVTVDRSALQMAVGDETSLTATVQAGDGSPLSGRDVTWRSDDEGVATVEGGLVVATGPGIATITATSEGATAPVAVTVRLETRAAIEGLVARYAIALESRDVAQMRQVFPDITAQRAQALEAALADMDGLQVDYTIDSWQEQGASATASVSATYRFRGGGRDQSADVPLQFTFSRTPTGWEIATVE